MKAFIKFSDENAIFPTKAHQSDTGFDLTAIRLHKVLPNGVRMYDTGIKVFMPENYYTEIVPRSSIVKTGWFLANSIGIIDQEYTGNLYICLAPINDTSVELELPFCVCQLVFRKKEDFSLYHYSDNDLPITERNSGGFGSTNKIKE